MHGDVASFSDENADTVIQQTGLARLWRRSSPASAYADLQTLLPADAESGDAFGSQVAIGDGFAFISSGNDSHNGKQSTGTVSLYRDPHDGTGHYQEVMKWAPNDLAPGAGFGESLDLDGDRLVVGAGGRGVQAGAAYVFERNAGGADSWVQVAEFNYPVRAPFEEVAVSGDTILVSRTGFNAPGHVDVYDRNPATGQWNLTKPLADPVNPVGELYGYHLALSGDLAVVAGRNAADAENGEAIVYGRNHGGANNWGPLVHLKSPNPQAAFYFGTSVAIMDNLILVGSLGLDSNPRGSVYVFAVPEPTGSMLIAIGTLAVSRIEARRFLRRRRSGASACSHSEHSS